MPKRISFRSVELAITQRQEALAAIDAATVAKPIRIATANPEFIEIASEHTAFKDALQNMTHVTIDGSGLYFALALWSFLTGKHLKPQLYHGADMVHDLLERYRNGQKTFFFLGGQPGVMAQAAERLKHSYPELAIAGTEDGGIISTEKGNLSKDLEKQLLAAKPDILIVGFGAPKQELWIDAATHLPIPVMIGVGGTLDFQTSDFQRSKKRAPKLVRSLHMEWLYRAFSEKGHWRRVVRAVVVFPLRSLSWIVKDFLLHFETQK
jgi:N-acetylglucosaminyldiphosphoundecaprenol N-acetyl-beta-D-mannosaminyltransferase